MDVKVRFRFNQITGEVEIFEVTDEGIMRLPEAEHNREHDRIAGELGNLIERNPQIMEVFSDTISTEPSTISELAKSEDSSDVSETQDQKQRQTE
jgi:hypothetical protein